MSTPEQYVSDLNAMLAIYFESKVEFQKEIKEFFKHAPINEEPLEAMRQEKTNLNKQARKPNHSTPPLLGLLTKIIVHAQTAAKQQSNGRYEARMSGKCGEWRD